MARPPDDPFWDTLDDETRAGPHESPGGRAPQGPRRLDPSKIITEPEYTRQAPRSPEPSAPGDVPPPLGLEPGVTSSLRAPADGPLPVAGAELRTTFSQQAVMIADLIRERFAGRSYGGAFYRLRIDDPDGPSTAGGRLARQPLSLVPRMDSAPVIVCGWVDVYKKDAQLRSHEVVMRRHHGRQGAGLPISAEAYERFLDELMNTLFEGGIRILVVVPEDQEALPAPPPAPVRRHPLRSFLGAVLLLGLGFGLGLSVERLEPWLERARQLLLKR